VPLRRVTPATLIGKGVVERVKAAVEEQGSAWSSSTTG
jgi:GTP-binding protein HflX